MTASAQLPGRPCAACDHGGHTAAGPCPGAAGACACPGYAPLRLSGPQEYAVQRLAALLCRAELPAVHLWLGHHPYRRATMRAAAARRVITIARRAPSVDWDVDVTLTELGRALADALPRL